MSLLKSGFNPETKIWSGPTAEEIYKTPIAIGEVIRSSLRKNPNKIAQLCANSGVTLTNEEILLRSLKIACYLKENFNLTQNDVASIFARNTENVASVVFGLIHCGISVNGLDTSLDTDEMISLYKYIKPKVVFCDADKYDQVFDALKTLENSATIFIVSENTEQNPTTSVNEMLTEISLEDTNNFIPVNPMDPQTHAAFIICSSGVTGTSKGVCIPHNFFLRRENFQSFSESAALLCFSSLYWISGVGILLGGTINGTTRIITDEPYSPQLMFRIIEQYKGSIVVLAPPSQLALMVKSPEFRKCDLSSLKAYMCGGSAISSILCDEFEKALPFYQTALIISYGCTELGQIAMTLYDSSKAGSVGNLSPNIQIKIIDDSGVALGPNERGEVCVKSPYCFVKYYGRPQDTATTLDSDNWVHMGDIGYMDDDGFLYLVDRKKEIMKYKNFHVSPSELEMGLSELNGVREVCVCGVPDAIYTDLPAALIVREPEANLSEEGVNQYMKAKFSDHKQLRGGVYFVDSLPMTPSGKIRRVKAKQIALNLYTKEN